MNKEIVDFEKNLLLIIILVKVFPYKRSGKTISSASDRDIRGGQISVN